MDVAEDMRKCDRIEFSPQVVHQRGAFQKIKKMCKVKKKRIY